MTTAERLFALHGIDGVSLRQIGAAAGDRQQLGRAVPLRIEGRPGEGDPAPPAAAHHSAPQAARPARSRPTICAARSKRTCCRSSSRPRTTSSYYTMFLEQLMRYGHRAASVRRSSRCLPGVAEGLRRSREPDAAQLPGGAASGSHQPGLGDLPARLGRSRASAPLRCDHGAVRAARERAVRRPGGLPAGAGVGETLAALAAARSLRVTKRVGRVVTRLRRPRRRARDRHRCRQRHRTRVRRIPSPAAAAGWS